MSEDKQQRILEHKDFVSKHAQSYLESNVDKTPLDKQELQENEDFVSIRIRPLLEDELKASPAPFPAVYCNGPRSVVVHDLSFKFNGTPSINSTPYKVDAAFGPDHSNDEVYEVVAKPLVPWVLEGGVGTLFAGSGKTHTVTAMEKMVARDLFAAKEDHIEIYICFFELFGNHAFDLLQDRSTINIMEDEFGSVQLVRAREQAIKSSDEFLGLIEQGAALRRTEATEKNHTSSRSHAVCRIRVINTRVRDADDGVLFLVDLVGSEGNADTKQHNKERIAESQHINKSLATLKDCIRNRALAGAPNAKHVHMPYRTSRLTHILKDTFDIKSSQSRHCKTVVIANVAPSIIDIQQSINTLRYVGPLKVAVPKTKMEFDPLHPATWNNEQLRDWISKNSGTPAIRADILAPSENGKQLCKLPQAEFITRCLKTEGVNSTHARAFYDKLWKLLIDARTPKTRAQTTPMMDNSTNKNTTPFTSRISPGMFVCPRASPITPPGVFAMILSPAIPSVISNNNYLYKSKQLAEEIMTKSMESEVDKAYLCCMLGPSVMQGTYELYVHQQFCLFVSDMEAEVSVEYDSATRMYYIVI